MNRRSKPTSIADADRHRESIRVRVRYAETDQMGFVYHTHYLVWCEVARTEYMRRAGVPYTEINVRATPDAEAQVRQWTGGDLISPVFDIDGTIVIDFKRAELTRVLGLE